MGDLVLELGGNGAAIVLGDADWKPLIPTLFNAAFGNPGQWCITIKCLYVHSSIHRDFVDAFVAHASNKRVGNGMDPDTDLSPIQNKMQYEKLPDLFADVTAQGYKVPLGGHIDQSLPGNFMPITIVDNPPENSRIVQEEPFGPILPIIAFDEIKDVIERANNSPFGPVGSVWSGDQAKGIEVGACREFCV